MTPQTEVSTRLTYYPAIHNISAKWTILLINLNLMNAS